MLYEHRFGPWFIEPIIAGLNDDACCCDFPMFKLPSV